MRTQDGEAPKHRSADLTKLYEHYILIMGGRGSGRKTKRAMHKQRVLAEQSRAREEQLMNSDRPVDFEDESWPSDTAVESDVEVEVESAPTARRVKTPQAKQAVPGPKAKENTAVRRIADGILQDEEKEVSWEDVDDHTPDELLAMLAQGAVSAQQAKLAWVQAMRGATAKDRDVLQTYINNADALVPATIGKNKQTPYSTIGMGHGKLVRLFMACRAHAKSDLHKGKAKSDHKREMKFDVNTMSVVLDIDPDENSTTVAIFNLAMAHFRHAVRIKDMLTEFECHSLDVWLATQMALATKLTVLERTMLRMLAIMDDDMQQSLVAMLDTRSDHLLAKELRIHEAEKPPKEPKNKGNFPDSAEKTTKALKKPNDVSCWFWTNGFTCKHKDEDGKCRFEKLHGTCGMPLANGGYCMHNGRATEHADH